MHIHPVTLPWPTKTWYDALEAVIVLRVCVRKRTAVAPHGEVEKPGRVLMFEPAQRDAGDLPREHRGGWFGKADRMNEEDRHTPHPRSAPLPHQYLAHYGTQEMLILQRSLSCGGVNSQHFCVTFSCNAS